MALRKAPSSLNILANKFPWLDASRVEAHKEKEQKRFREERLDKEAKRAAHEDLFLEAWQDICQNLLSQRSKGKVPAPRKKIRVEREANIAMSDLHIGANTDGREVPIAYGRQAEARAIGCITQKVLDYKRQYRKDSILRVHAMGDLFQGQLHDQRDGYPLAEQVGACVHLLDQAICHWAEDFTEVKVDFVSGNHGRNTARHQDRATLQKWDSIETMVGIALKNGFKHIKNVSINIHYTPYYTWNSFGEMGFATHGDTVLNVGYPGRSINVAAIEKQVYKINAAHEKPFKVFMVGHVHTGTYINLPNGSIVFTNGAAIPPDPYSVSIGQFQNACGQWLFESVPGHMVGDQRYLSITPDVYENAAYDKLIVPYKGL